tara:strand:- start:39 stop:284 length:246 start_codon:yes stop_codon:yes gene_type:complete
MNDSLNNITEGFCLYNTNFEYLGISGRFQKLDENGNTQWIQLKDNEKYCWLSGKLTKSYKRGFIIEDMILIEKDTNNTIIF